MSVSSLRKHLFVFKKICVLLPPTNKSSAIEKFTAGMAIGRFDMTLLQMPHSKNRGAFRGLDLLLATTVGAWIPRSSRCGIGGASVDGQTA